MKTFRRHDQDLGGHRPQLASDGFEFRRGFLDPITRQTIAREVKASGADIPQYGIRNAERKYPAIAALARSTPIVECVREYVPGPTRLIRSIFFDKTPAANWYVTWHQDKTVAVPRRFEAPGWGPWSMKDGVAHVQPPRRVLEGIVTLRIHIDDADESNGCLQVVPGSHAAGVIPTSEVRLWVDRGPVENCIMKAGDALLMRPLLLHASRRAVNPAHRRVLHLEFGDFDFPDSSADAPAAHASPG